MISFGNMLFISGLVDYFVILIAVDPRIQIKGKDNVQRYKGLHSVQKRLCGILKSWVF